MKYSLVSVVLAIAHSLECQPLPRTPYPPSATPAVGEVVQMRVRTRESRKIRNFQALGQASITVFEAGMGYCKGASLVSDGWKIEGKESGSSFIVDMAELQSFTLQSWDEASIKLKVTMLPMLTEDQLVKRSPTWEALKANFGKAIQLDLPRRRDGGEACIIGKKLDYEEARTRMAFLSQLSPLRVTRFDYDSNLIWWAIPSIVASRDYPFRVGLDGFVELGEIKKQ